MFGLIEIVKLNDLVTALARPAPQQNDSLYRVQNISGADGLSVAVSRCTNNVLLSLNNLEK